MVGQSSISSVLFLLTNLKKTLYSLMMPTKIQKNISFLLLSSLKRKGLCSQANCINGNRSSSSMLSKNMQGMKTIGISVGAEIISWIFNNNTISLKKQKAPIWRRSFFYIVRCEWKLNNSTLASREFTCNNSVGCYV